MPIELTVTAKGQVTLRRSVLGHLGVGPGQKLGVALLLGGRVELRPVEDLPAVADLRGALRRSGAATRRRPGHENCRRHQCRRPLPGLG